MMATVMRIYMVLCVVGLASTILVGVMVFQGNSTKGDGIKYGHDQNNQRLDRKSFRVVPHPPDGQVPKKFIVDYSDSIPPSVEDQERRGEIGIGEGQGEQETGNGGNRAHQEGNEAQSQEEKIISILFIPERKVEIKGVPKNEVDHRSTREENPVVVDAPVKEIPENTTLIKPSRVERTCTPGKNIVMIKTHKCSSSTLQNIIFRYGEDHKLDIALPREGVYLGSPRPFNKFYVADYVVGKKYNILANHLLYNEPQITEIMNDNSIYVTILRNPATQFESMFTYYNYEGRYGATLRQFLMQGESLFRTIEPRRARQVGRNPMSFDVGLDARFLEANSPAVQRFIERMDEKYHLVLIAEYFDQSLVLLKDLLCWSLDDVVYFTQNARSKTSVKNITASQIGAIYRWNAVDTIMYKHFNRTLWQKIDAYGREKMDIEVSKLKQKNEYLKNTCIGATIQSGDKRVWYPDGIKVKSFILNPNAQNIHLCDQMTRPELTYIKKLKENITPIQPIERLRLRKDRFNLKDKLEEMERQRRVHRVQLRPPPDINKVPAMI